MSCGRSAATHIYRRFLGRRRAFGRVPAARRLDPNYPLTREQVDARIAELTQRYGGNQAYVLPAFIYTDPLGRVLVRVRFERKDGRPPMYREVLTTY